MPLLAAIRSTERDMSKLEAAIAQLENETQRLEQMAGVLQVEQVTSRTSWFNPSQYTFSNSRTSKRHT